MRRLLKRWAHEENTALTRQLRGKSAKERFNGLNRSERNEAKLLLLAMAPSVAVLPWVPKWSDASDWQKLLMAAAMLWAVGVVFVGGFYIIRSLMRLSRSQKGE